MTDNIAEARKMITRPQIRDAFLRNGATIPADRDDLPDWVYEAAFELLEMAPPAVPVRYTYDGALAECPCCGSLDVGGAHDTVHCQRCGLTVTKPRPLQNAVDAWNARSGRVHSAPAVQGEPEDMRFMYQHPKSGETHSVSSSREEVAEGMNQELFERLAEAFCTCDPVGETNVVDCRCDEYADEFEMVLAPQPTEQRCEHCDGTGDVHRADGEWRGVCACPAGQQRPPAPITAGMLEAIWKHGFDSENLGDQAYCQPLINARNAVDEAELQSFEWPKLENPAKVGGVRFGAGVSSRLVVEAAQRQYEYDVTPEKEARRIARFDAFRQEVLQPIRESAMLIELLQDIEKGCRRCVIPSEQTLSEWAERIDAALSAHRKGGES